jgi:hypothetical protein
MRNVELLRQLIPECRAIALCTHKRTGSCGSDNGVRGCSQVAVDQGQAVRQIGILQESNVFYASLAFGCA